jgi:hypothetical protein
MGRSQSAPPHVGFWGNRLPHSVTISVSSGRRNLTFGQGSGRLRTSTTNGNGIPWVVTFSGALTTALQHIVYSRTTGGAVTI